MNSCIFCGKNLDDEKENLINVKGYLEAEDQTINILFQFGLINPINGEMLCENCGYNALFNGLMEVCNE